MSKIRFGPGGNPHTTPDAKTPEGKKPSSRQVAIYRLKELDLDHIEVEFVRGVNISDESALELGELAAQKEITLTAHGPYYINLASLEKPKYHASLNRIKKTYKAAKFLKAKSITFHAAFYQKQDPKKVSEIVRKAILDILKSDTDCAEDNSPLISPETTGKPSQWGTVEEICEVSDAINQELGVFRASICIDFAHLHARTNGQLNTYEEFSEILETVETKLGREALDNLHMHISGINYSPKGERNHLNLEEADLNYKDILRALKDHNVGGWAVCESPNLEDDAALLKKEYERLI